MVEARVPFAATSVPTVRAQMRRHLHEHAVPEPVIDDAALVLTEMMSNAIRHAAPVHASELIVAYAVDGDGVEIMVTDGARDGVPRAGHGGLWSQSGRGLRIVGRLAHDWGVRSGEAGKTVWAQVRLQSARAADSLRASHQLEVGLEASRATAGSSAGS